MAMMNSIRGFPVNMNFVPPLGVTPMDGSAFMTPQEKYLAQKAAEQQQAQQAPAAGGVPGAGGGGIDPLAALPQAGGGGQGGMMASIMKFLPMMMGGMG